MNFIFRLLSVACITLTALACGGEAPSIFSIPSGSQLASSGDNVFLQNIPADSVVYLTTDGEIPTENDCDPFDIATPIPITTNRTVKVLVVTGGTPTAIQTANYTVEGASTDYTNEDMIYAWHGWEKDVRCEMNSCNEPSGTGDWNFTCPGGGSVNWHIALSGVAGDSTFTYSNCTYTSTDETTGLTSTLTVNGFMHGVFGLAKDDDTDGNVTITGDFNGYVEDHVEIRNAIKTGGSYITTCSDANCASGDATYLVSWDGSANQFAYFAPGGAGGDAISCAVPWYLIRNKSNSSNAGTDKCMVNSAGDVLVADCDAADPNQQWTFTDDSSAWLIGNNGDGTCASDENTNVGTATCSTGDDAQRWTLSGTGDDVEIKNVGRNFCMYSAGSDVVGSGGNCGLLTEIRWGFYFEGDLGASTNPAGLNQ